MRKSTGTHSTDLCLLIRAFLDLIDPFMQIPTFLVNQVQILDDVVLSEISDKI